jgi:hypothetical protein
MARCQRIKSDGSRCKLPANGSHGLCWSHDPSKAAERVRVARTGGYARGGSEIGEIKATLRKIMEGAMENSTEVTRANAYLAIHAGNALMNCIRTELKQREQLEILDRFEQLEDALMAKDSTRYHHYGHRS